MKTFHRKVSENFLRTKQETRGQAGTVFFMSETQLREILSHIEATLDIYRTQEGKLTVLEVSMKSMITTLRAQIEMQLAGAWQSPRG